MREAEATTARAFIETLMDVYQNPPDDTESAETIISMAKQISDLESENAALRATEQNLNLEIAELKKQLGEANRIANDNALSGLGKEAQIEDLRKQMEGAIIVRLNPVSAYFMAEIVEESGMKPADVLEKLFDEDLQQPRSNNFPGGYSVSSARMRRVAEEIKKQHDAKQE